MLMSLVSSFTFHTQFLVLFMFSHLQLRHDGLSESNRKFFFFVIRLLISLQRCCNAILSNLCNSQNVYYMQCLYAVEKLCLMEH